MSFIETFAELNEAPGFRVLVADPPWPFGDSLPGGGRGAAKHYNLASVDDICKVQIPKMATDSVLFLWRVAALGDDAYRVARAWGFEPKTELVWLKRSICWRCRGEGRVKTRAYVAYGVVPGSGAPERVYDGIRVVVCPECEGRGTRRWFGMGRYTRAEHESCIIATRGRASGLVKDRAVRSTFEAVVPKGRHSAKPPEFFELVERMFDGPYVELFARTNRAGWTQTGQQLGLEGESDADQTGAEETGRERSV